MTEEPTDVMTDLPVREGAEKHTEKESSASILKRGPANAALMENTQLEDARACEPTVSFQLEVLPQIFVDP
jgi:hypothetical protein